jgi:arylsulfatase
VRSEKEVPTGKNVKLRFEFEKTGKEKFGAGGIGRMYINDSKVGEGQIPRTVKFMYANYEGFDIGVDTGTPVTDEYKTGARFTGIIEKVVIDLSGERHIDPEAETKVALKSQ